MTFSRLCIATVLLSLMGGGVSPGAAAAPWQLSDALDTPDWLSLNGSYRMRYETLDGPFRAGATGTDDILVERLLLGAEARFNGYYAGAELEDSRAQLDDAGTPLGTDDVNTLELLRAYVGYRGTNVFAAGDAFDIQAGRMTMNVGSRRFVARNRFRNTLNAFTGINAVWTGGRDMRLQAFFTLPVNREPGERARLHSNDTAFDDESFHTYFWGAHLTRSRLMGALSGEIYVFGLHEEDRPAAATSNRRLVTPGLRLYTQPAAGHWDVELEGALQTGTSRASTAAEARDLDHFAGFFRVAVGHTFDVAWSPRLVLEYDYASGDSDPADGENNSFDTLYGARRFDFGPTGTYGAFARNNISAPGLRAQAAPTESISGFVGYRAVWLASDRDSLSKAGLADPTGRSGSFVGHQLEARLRFDLLPGNLRMEIGGAYLVDGAFLKAAPEAPREGDTRYLYAQTAISF